MALKQQKPSNINGFLDLKNPFEAKPDTKRQYIFLRYRSQMRGIDCIDIPEVKTVSKFTSKEAEKHAIIL